MLCWVGQGDHRGPLLDLTLTEQSRHCTKLPRQANNSKTSPIIHKHERMQWNIKEHGAVQSVIFVDYKVKRAVRWHKPHTLCFPSCSLVHIASTCNEVMAWSHRAGTRCYRGADEACEGGLQVAQGRGHGVWPWGDHHGYTAHGAGPETAGVCQVPAPTLSIKWPPCRAPSQGLWAREAAAPRQEKFPRAVVHYVVGSPPRRSGGHHKTSPQCQPYWGSRTEWSNMPLPTTLLKNQTQEVQREKDKQWCQFTKEIKPFYIITVYHKNLALTLYT